LAPFTFSTRREPEDEDFVMSTVSPQSEPKLDRDALAAMYEETFRNFEEGTITEGVVVAIGKDKVVVDIGYKSEGMIPADQFSQEELQQLKVGDRLQVYLEECEDADGPQYSAPSAPRYMSARGRIIGLCRPASLQIFSAISRSVVFQPLRM